MKRFMQKIRVRVPYGVTDLKANHCNTLKCALHINPSGTHVRFAAETTLNFKTVKNIIMTTKSIFTDLVFDRELVKTVKRANVSKDQLYNLLVQGKITLQEYLRMV